MVEERFFAHYEKIETSGTASVLFIVPESLERFDLSRVVIIENRVLSDAGGAQISVSELCSQKFNTDKGRLSTMTVQGSTPVPDGTSIQPSAFVGSFMDFEGISVSGGDAVVIDVDCNGVIGAVVHVAVVGMKVGEF